MKPVFEEKPLPPITLRELPHWVLALFFVYVVASNYDPLWIFEPAPGTPIELIETPVPLKMTAAPIETTLPVSRLEPVCPSASLAGVIDPSC